jgi:hypothetical protein
MWYELEMLPETLDSLQNALQYAQIPVDIAVCFNKQTYIEKPILDTIDEKFEDLSKHPILKNATIIEKTDNDPFFNVGDWRRAQRTKEGYTIWGESDTLIPSVYFPMLEQIWSLRDQLRTPHVISIASRKMWDHTWAPVEHPAFSQFTIHANGKSSAPHPLGHDHYINQEQLDEFNNQHASDLQLTIINPPKLDGSLLALHPDLPPLSVEGVQVTDDDYCSQLVLTKLNIPQYHISNLIKGHNYHHPRKRTNTNTPRNEFGEVLRGGDVFNAYRKQSDEAIAKFIGGLV